MSVCDGFDETFLKRHERRTHMKEERDRPISSHMTARTFNDHHRVLVAHV